jgi:peptidoglycan/LPS O-acetylase OafA/YrhL
MTDQSRPSGSGSRLFYLDGVRAFAMIFGIFSHGTTIGHTVVDQTPIFYWVQFWNELIRNMLFFFVSGFFAALLANRGDMKAFWRNRVDAIVIPLIAGMILIVPFTNWLVNSWHNGPIGFVDYLSGGWRRPSVGNDTWALHLWFLYSLLICTALTPLLLKLVKSAAFSRGIDAYLDRTGRFTPWFNVLLFCLAVVFGVAVFNLVFKPLVEGTKLQWITRATLTFLPYFFMGVVCFVHRRFLDSFTQLNLPGFLLFLGLYFLARSLGDAGLPFAIERSFYWFARSGLTFFAATAIVWLFRRFLDKPSPLLTFLVDAAYPFYLFHFASIYLVAHAARAAGMTDLVAIWVMVILVAMPATFLFYWAVISRFEWTRRLFTGKRAKKPAPAAALAKG